MTAASTLAGGPGATAVASPGPATPPRSVYLGVLGLAFGVFGTLRLVSYLPTLWALHVSGDASQHSLWTWGIWLGSHLTMAAWLYEQSAHRLDRAVLLSLCNAAMCSAACMLIIGYRIAG